jgi:hypothetical protein
MNLVEDKEGRHEHAVAVAAVRPEQVLRRGRLETSCRPSRLEDRQKTSCSMEEPRAHRPVSSKRDTGGYRDPVLSGPRAIEIPQVYLTATC